MANQVYGSSSYGYAGGSNPSSIFTSRSIADQYVSADSSLHSSSRLFGSDPLSSSSNLYSFSALSDKGPSMLYNHNDTIGSGYSAAARATAGATLWPGPPGVDVDVNATSLESIYAGYKRSSSEALYHQSLLGTHSTIGQSEVWYSTNPLVKRPRFQCSFPVYPQRPGEKDCAHYMLTRTCKFGDCCRFDHPLWVPEGGIPDWKEVPVSVTSEDLPQRPDVPDCPYFLKTQTCKFGPMCKFNHPKDKVASLFTSENTQGSELPERPSEPACAFYMKTGICKFGSTCKFHHPKDVLIPGTMVENGNGGQTEATTGVTNRNLTTVKPPFAPALLHNSKGLPLRPIVKMADNRDEYIQRLEAQLQQATERLQEYQQGGAKKPCSYETFISCQPPIFEGTNNSSLAMSWLREMKQALDACDCEDPYRVRYAIKMFRGPVIEWWESVVNSTLPAELENMTWVDFHDAVYKQYCTEFEMARMEREFLGLRKCDKPIEDLIVRFSELMKFVPHLLPNEAVKVRWFADAIPSNYHDTVRMATTLNTAFDLARQYECDHPDRKETSGGFKQKSNQEEESKKTLSQTGSKQESSKTSRMDTPWRTKFRSYHDGDCTKDTMPCVRCGQRGHEVKDCQYTESVCLKCKKPGHRIADCTAQPEASASGSTVNQKEIPRAKGRCYQMIEE